MKFNTLVKATRGPFLILTPVCILFAYAIAAQTVHLPNIDDTLMILLGALAAHLAVNLLNEYQDFQSGLDLVTVKTPFSGGSGALPQDPQSAGLVLLSAIAGIAVVCWVGIHFVFGKGALALLPMGALGLLLIVGYTRIINRYAWLCLMAPGLGFGTLMVLCSVYLLSGKVTADTLLLSLVPFFLVNNLLLLNQFPDIEADKSVGRRHFVITYGPQQAARIYALFMVLPFVIIAGLMLSEKLPITAIWALMPLLPGILVVKTLNRLGADIAKEPKYLGLNVLVTLSTPTLLAIALLI